MNKKWGNHSSCSARCYNAKLLVNSHKWDLNHHDLNWLQIHLKGKSMIVNNGLISTAEVIILTCQDIIKHNHKLVLGSGALKGYLEDFKLSKRVTRGPSALLTTCFFVNHLHKHVTLLVNLNRFNFKLECRFNKKWSSFINYWMSLLSITGINTVVTYLFHTKFNLFTSFFYFLHSL